MKEYFCIACGRKHNGKYSSRYCRKHKWQLDKYGKLLDSNPRTKYDPNEFRFIKDYVEFDTYNYPSQDVCKTYIIDSEDYPRVSKMKWFTTSSGYAFCRDSQVLLHRFVMNGLPGQEFDHINRDITDNRKSNLRLSTSSLNKLNQRVRCDNKFGIKGVSKHNNGLYSCTVIIQGKKYISPCYKTLNEVAFARYIIEQLFVKDYIRWDSTELFEQLTISQKEAIISGIKEKFNIS